MSNFLFTVLLCGLISFSTLCLFFTFFEAVLFFSKDEDQ